MGSAYHLHRKVTKTLGGACGGKGKHHASCIKGIFAGTKEISCVNRGSTTPVKRRYKCTHAFPDSKIFRVPSGWSVVVEKKSIGFIEPITRGVRKAKRKPARKKRTTKRRR